MGLRLGRFLTFSIRQVALETASLQFLRSRMLTSVSQFFFMSLLMVSMYRNFGIHLDLTPSTTMSSTVLVIWLSSLRLTCPYQRSRLCIRCVVIGWTVAASLISSFLLCSLRLTPCIHSVLFISISSFFFLFHCPASSPMCHSRSYKTFADYLCMQDNCPQPRRFAPGLWKCYSVRHFRSPSPQTSGLAELCCTVDNGNPPAGAHFTSPVCTALVTHSSAHQIQTAATRLSLSPPTGSCIPIITHQTIHSGKVPAIGR